MSLPTVDISPFISNKDAKAKQECAKVVHKACTDTGFFLISNFQEILPMDELEKMFCLAHEFFTLPQEEKAKLKCEENRGYFAIGQENLTTIYTQLNETFVNKELGDYKEGLDLGREIDDSEIGLPFRRKNEWPQALGPEWKAGALDYFARVTKLGHVLMRIFAVALDLDEYWFEDKLDKPQTLLRILHYPPLPPGEVRFGCGAHSDYGCCTILAQDGTGGLQLLNTSGQWVDVSCAKDTLVVNVGDMMQRWTNDVYKSTVHRVINPSGKHRFSIPFFFEPNFDTEVSCIETCKKDKVLYPPIKFGDHIQNMYNATFVVQQK
eukprot:Phypoly_transcript_13009.p1 GENE.Phypoly_transcript_13009~~Phypoly_transcript_13009.p1  ORF type:complete len:322 (+),score=46.74 Phypoly_transcript_13009:63-1028(+)